MLALTATALEVVRTITADENTPDGAGLRIATPADADTEGSLELSVAAGPAEDDQVLSGEGATIFIDSGAAGYLADKVLDAEIGEDGTATFAVAPQEGNGVVEGAEPV